MSRPYWVPWVVLIGGTLIVAPLAVRGMRPNIPTPPQPLTDGSGRQALVKWKETNTNSLPQPHYSYMTYGRLTNVGTEPLTEVTIEIDGDGARRGFGTGQKITISAAWPRADQRLFEMTNPVVPSYLANTRVTVQPGEAWDFLLQAAIDQVPAPIRVVDGQGRLIPTEQQMPAP